MKKKSKLKTFLNITIFIVITAIVLYFTLKDNFYEVIDGILSANIWFVLLSLVFVCGYWFFKSLIFYNFTRKFKKDYKFRKAFKLQLVTNFFNAITPFSSGGQPFQIYTLKKQGVELIDSTNIIIENFIVYQIALVSLGLISIGANSIFHIFKDAQILKQLVTIGFIINTLVIVGLFIIAFGKKINRWIVNHLISLLAKLKLVKNKEEAVKKWNDYINNFHNGAKILVSDKKCFIKMIIYAMLALVCLYITPVILLYSTGDYTSFNALLSIVACSYVMLIGSFVPIPGGTGGLEYGFIQFFGNFLIGSNLHVIMILWRFATYYFGMIVGAVAVNIKEGAKKCE